MCKTVGPALQFVRKYGPAIKYYNPDLTVVKDKNPEGPLMINFEIYKK